jgi:hypothetical protein
MSHTNATRVISAHVTTQHNTITKASPAVAHIVGADKAEILRSILEKDFDLHGERLHIVVKAVDILDTAHCAFSIAEMAGLVAEGGILAGIASGIAVSYILLFPFGGIIEIVNCGEAGRRVAGMAAVAYTITAWAFGDPIPKLPPRVRSNVSAYGKAMEVPWYEAAWKSASDAAIRNLAALMAKKPGVSKSVFQALFRAAGDDSRQKLCRALLNGFDTAHIEKRTLLTYIYPH